MELMHLLKNAIYIALIFLLSGIIHEMGHIIMCYVLRCRLSEVKIWFIKIKKCNERFSFEFDLKEKEHCTFYSGSKKKMMAIMAMGPIANLLLFIVFLTLLLLDPNYVWLCSMIYNFVLFVNNLRPFENSDGSMVIKAWREIREEETK